jgi:anti-sigma B factor antagonist
MAILLPITFHTAVFICGVLNIAWRKELTLTGGKSTRFDTLETSIIATRDGALVQIEGPIDIDYSPTLRAQLIALLPTLTGQVVTVDLSRVGHIDSSGIATLVEALKIARSYNTELRLQGLQGRLLRLFQSTGILSLFNESARTSSEVGGEAV